MDEQLALHLELLYKESFAASRKVVRFRAARLPVYSRIYMYVNICVMQDISDAEVELQEQASVFRSKLLAKVAEIERQRQQIERQRQVSTFSLFSLPLPFSPSLSLPSSYARAHTHTHTHTIPFGQDRCPPQTLTKTQ